MNKIERKFLLKEIPANIHTEKAIYIEQTFLSLKPEIRVRKDEIYENGKSNIEYTLITRSKGDLTYDETIIHISQKSYEGWLKTAITEPIKKCRYVVPLYNDYIAHIDIFEDLGGLVVAEVEFKDEEQMSIFIVPSYFGKEITFDERYKNRNLAKRK